ncbi:hypothetical protein HDU98_002094 [Podochytrium sp. JEL0797]|nr:hypothetical protein HDU98_002094 [Podochytrium sp. JEL0797]
MSLYTGGSLVIGNGFTIPQGQLQTFSTKFGTSVQNVGNTLSDIANQNGNLQTIAARYGVSAQVVQSIASATVEFFPKGNTLIPIFTQVISGGGQVQRNGETTGARVGGGEGQVMNGEGGRVVTGEGGRVITGGAEGGRVNTGAEGGRIMEGGQVITGEGGRVITGGEGGRIMEGGRVITGEGGRVVTGEGGRVITGGAEGGRVNTGAEGGRIMEGGRIITGGTNTEGGRIGNQVCQGQILSPIGQVYSAGQLPLQNNVIFQEPEIINLGQSWGIPQRTCGQIIQTIGGLGANANWGSLAQCLGTQFGVPLSTIIGLAGSATNIIPRTSPVYIPFYNMAILNMNRIGEGIRGGGVVNGGNGVILQNSRQTAQTIIVIVVQVVPRITRFSTTLGIPRTLGTNCIQNILSAVQTKGFGRAANPNSTDTQNQVMNIIDAMSNATTTSFSAAQDIATSNDVPIVAVQHVASNVVDTMKSSNATNGSLYGTFQAFANLKIEADTAVGSTATPSAIVIKSEAIIAAGLHLLGMMVMAVLSF